ncbi:MAG: WYL domain-containing protein [Bacteroidales bacterium]|nr:WYL domain-containing protein [Bacteroidales bacterium]
MDQPKMERMLRLMQLLSGNVYYTVSELESKLEISRRTVFRYFDTFKSAGFVVQHIGDGRYRMMTYNKEYSDLSQLVYFSEEEAIVVSHLIENLDAANALKAGLKQKLAAVYDSTSISDYIENKGKSEIIESLANAVKTKRQVALKDYASAHSGQTKDYVVEPYKFTRGFVDVIAYDTAAGFNKVFKISRVGSVKMLEGWKNEDRHEDKIIDSFRMSGSPVEHVKLKMTLRAKDLLTEEFPITGAEVSGDKNAWYWEGDVNSLEGVGRFVIGLSEEIAVEEGTLLKAWLVDKGAQIREKFKK